VAKFRSVATNFRRIMQKQYFELMRHQQLINRFFGHVNNDFLVLFHSTGSGKTCSSVLVAEKYIKYINSIKDKVAKVYIFSNKSSEEEFIQNIIGECGNLANNLNNTRGNKYISKSEIEQLEKIRLGGDLQQYKKLKKEFIVNRLRAYGYRFFTHQILGRESILDKIDNFDNSLVIVDEVHSFLNENKFVQTFNKIKYRSKNYKLLLLSATPMINDPRDIVNFINIIVGHDEKVKTENMFNSFNKLTDRGKDLIIDKLSGKISYYYSKDIKYFNIIITLLYR